jgi:capsular exopolysaccharide synthesis family protein
MSRFYDALREAGKSGELGQDSPAPPQPAEPIQKAEAEKSVVTDTHAQPHNGIDPQSAPRGAAPVPGGSAISDANGAKREPKPAAAYKSGPLSFPHSARVLPNASKGVVLEQYRKLRTKILQQNQTRPFRTLAITSPGPREGKTTTALNLALCFGMLPSYRVLVVDADVRRGSLGSYLGIADGPGFSNVIEGTARIEDVILPCPEGPMDVVLRGNSAIPPELLFSGQIETHFMEMGQLYDLVIIDTPPVNLIVDSQIIASKCDATLLIARAFSTTRKAMEKASQELSGARVIGAVLNSGTRGQVYRSYGGYY